MEPQSAIGSGALRHCSINWTRHSANANSKGVECTEQVETREQQEEEPRVGRPAKRRRTEARRNAIPPGEGGEEGGAGRAVAQTCALVVWCVKEQQRGQRSERESVDLLRVFVDENGLQLGRRK